MIRHASFRHDLAAAGLTSRASHASSRPPATPKLLLPADVLPLELIIHQLQL